MTSLAFVDVPNLFHGFKRSTGDPAARLDYVKLRKWLSTSTTDLFLAYVSSLMVGGDATDGSFIRFLTRAGYEVRRRYSGVQVEGEQVSYTRTTSYGEMQLDSIRYVPQFDRVVIVSACGHMFPVAQKAKEHGKRLVMVTFSREFSHKAIEEMADEVLRLDAAYKLIPVVQRDSRD